jgi:protocatechuate 3,4-dioxygenase beta subunit
VRLATRPSVGPEFVSNGSGRFAVVLAREVTSVVSADSRYATVLSGAGSTQSDAIVVVAPRIELAGTVVDETGARLQGVGISITLPAGFGADFGQPLDTALEKRWTAETGTDGTFSLADLPAVVGSNLRAELGAFEPHAEPVTLSGARDLWIVLRQAGVASTKLHGLVLDMYGNRMHGARVALGTQTVFSDEGGRFEVDAAQDPVPTRIVALMTGFQPAILEPADGHFPSEIMLQLGAAPLSLSGRVVDEHDQPVQSARVWLTDPTPFGIVENEPLHVEALTSGDDKRFWAWVQTDAEGHFRLDGLLERDYGIGALDPRTLLQTQTSAAAGRDDVVIQLPAGQILPVVRGHVVTYEGAGVPDVPVMVQRPGFTFIYADGGTRDEFSHRPPVTTDKDGAFEFHDVPRAGVELFANGETILFANVRIEDVTDPLDVKIRAHLRRHLQVELNPPLDRADALRVLDSGDHSMILRIMRGATSFTNRQADIVDGRSQVLSLSDEARTVVLFKAGAEVGRVGVSLSSGDVQTVRW